MYKVVSFVRFGEGIDVGERMEYWLEVHGPLFAKLPGLQRYIQNHAVGSLEAYGIGDGFTAFKGYSSAWWKDEASFRVAAASPEWQAVVADFRLMCDADWMFDGWTAEIEERVIKPVREGCLGFGGHGDLFKVVWVARFDPALTNEEARDHWTNIHGPIALQTEEIGNGPGYVQNHAINSLAADGRGSGIPLGFHGFSECWFDSLDAYMTAMGRESWARLSQDGMGLFDMDALFAGMSASLREYLLVG